MHAKFANTLLSTQYPPSLSFPISLSFSPPLLQSIKKRIFQREKPGASLIERSRRCGRISRESVPRVANCLRARGRVRGAARELVHSRAGYRFRGSIARGADRQKRQIARLALAVSALAGALALFRGIRLPFWSPDDYAPYESMNRARAIPGNTNICIYRYPRRSLEASKRVTLPATSEHLAEKIVHFIIIHFYYYRRVLLELCIPAMSTVQACIACCASRNRVHIEQPIVILGNYH